MITSTRDYTANFGGTSSACPLAAGVTALLLDANPNLTWRDVQHILIRTAEKNDPNSGGWSTNGAGYLVSHDYGFGRVNASRAVSTALNWTNVGDEVGLQGNSFPYLDIPDDDPAGVKDVIHIPENIKIEAVEVLFWAPDHTYWGDLEVRLVSPAGTTSVLTKANALSDDAYRFNGWTFTSWRHFGEYSRGDWILKVRDVAEYDTGVFQRWILRVYGATANPPASSVIYRSPEIDASEVSISSQITIRFSRPMDPATLANGLILNGVQRDLVPGTVTYNSNLWQARFTPDSTLRYNTRYTLAVTSSVKDETGQSAAPESWSFTTETNSSSPTSPSGGSSSGGSGGGGGGGGCFIGAL